MDWLMVAIGILSGVPVGFFLCALCTTAARADQTSPSTATAAALPSEPSGSVDEGGIDTGAAVDGEGNDHAAMRAMLVAGRRVRRDRHPVSFRWLRGAPTHVLAELLGELRADGWVLRRANTSPGGVGVRHALAPGAPEPPISHGGHAPSGGDILHAHDTVRDMLDRYEVWMPGLAASAILERLNADGFLILTRDEVAALGRAES